MKKLHFLSIVVCCLFLITAKGFLNADTSNSCCKKAVQKSGCAFNVDKAKKTEISKLCGQCGEIKGSVKCCRKNAKKCLKCGLIKGSSGCCKITKGKDVELCSNCGEIKGVEKCCRKDAEKYSKCSLIKGSVGCCKIKKKKT